MSRGPKTFRLAMSSRRAAFSTSLIATFSIVKIWIWQSSNYTLAQDCNGRGLYTTCTTLRLSVFNKELLTYP